MRASAVGSRMPAKTGAGGSPLEGTLAVVILATAEWDSAIATNQHYVARELAREFSVIFVEGAGTRRVTLNRSDMDRILRRLTGRRSGHQFRTVPDNLTIVSTILVPFHGRVGRAINRLLVARQLQRRLGRSKPDVLWTYTPYTLGLDERAARVVYHLVDLIQNNPGVNRHQFVRAEARLAKRPVRAVASSSEVRKHLEDVGFREVYTRLNVADTTVFIAATSEAARSAPPEVIFAGAITESKLDFRLLELLAEALKGAGKLVLAGPASEAAHGGRPLESLRSRGVEFTGLLGRTELARRLAEATVGVIPYRISDLTRGISPLKTFEYLAAGLPVVSTPLPDVTPVDGCIWVTGDATKFVDLTMTLLSSEDGRPAVRNARQSYARRNDWSARGDEYRRWIREFRHSPDGSNA